MAASQHPLPLIDSSFFGVYTDPSQLPNRRLGTVSPRPHLGRDDPAQAGDEPENSAAA
jgi:hypothetical protein